MEELIIPDEGIVVKTRQGRVVLDLLLNEKASMFRMFGTDGNPKIGLGYNEDSHVLMVGDENRSVILNSSDDVSEINIINSGKNISLAVAEGASEIRFQNEDGKMTNKIYIDEFGGQMGLSDNEGNLQFSAGVTAAGGILHILNNYGNTVISLSSNKETGQLLLLDEKGKILVYIDCSGGAGVILLLDKEGNTIWSNFSE